MTAESIALRAGNPRPCPIMHQYLLLPHHLPPTFLALPTNLIKHFAEAMRAETIRKGQSGVCWMYGIICMELVLLVFLLYIGISNQ